MPFTPYDLMSEPVAEKQKYLQEQYFRIAAYDGYANNYPEQAKFNSAKVSDLDWSTNSASVAVDQLDIADTIQKLLRLATNARINIKDLTDGFACNGAKTTNDQVANYWVSKLQAAS